jgi:ubiquinone/menaquinone biosynthesis C-methylase UbiE
VSLWGLLFARFYDRVMATTEEAGLSARRRQLLAGVSGRVVEIGAGTGANLPHYPETVVELVLVEPEAAMRAQLARRLRGDAAAGQAARRASILAAGAESIPLADGSFDCAVSTLALCTVEDQARALAELARVLRPGGRLVFIEHVRAQEPRLQRWQDRLQPLWRRPGRGCRLNRDTLAAIEAAGFRVVTLERGAMPKAPAIVRPMIAGAAVLDSR